MTTPDLQFDRDILGKEFPAGEFHIDKERIIQYCEAVGETESIYTDEEAAKRSGYRSIVAPPGYCNLLERASARPDIHLQFRGTGLHQWQAVESFAPIQAGDTLQAKVRLRDVYARPGRNGHSAVVVWETTFTNQDGTIVASVQASHLTRPRAEGA